ncbi:MAG: hypothetical protein RB191_05665 [Terriglobia bacterium]|nr:hypothetical protein [Terriglobia bacterium]
MHRFSALILSFAVAAALGCGSSANSGSIGSPTPVQAAAYSTASFAGTYAIQLSQASIALNSLGTITADGAGNLSSGTLAEYYSGDFSAACPVTVTGTYTVDSAGTGSATLVFTSSHCAETGTVQFALQAAQQGSTALLVESDQQTGLSGSLSKK